MVLIGSSHLQSRCLAGLASSQLFSAHAWPRLHSLSLLHWDDVIMMLAHAPPVMVESRIAPVQAKTHHFGSENHIKGEIGFFDDYVITFAEKLKGVVYAAANASTTP